MKHRTKLIVATILCLVGWLYLPEPWKYVALWATGFFNGAYMALAGAARYLVDHHPSLAKEIIDS